jgi:heme oxygenase
MPKTFMARLREAIWPMHDYAEEKGPLHALIKGSMTREEYIEALKRIRGFTAPLEEAIGRELADKDVGLDFDARRRLPDIDRDLEALGLSRTQIEALPRAVGEMPRLCDTGRALGAMYVFEGSRLGGQVLAVELDRQFGYGPDSGAAYFSSAGKNAQVMWQEFKSAVELQSAEEGVADAVIAGAQDTFSAFNRWLERELPVQEHANEQGG